MWHLLTLIVTALAGFILVVAVLGGGGRPS